MHTFYAAVGRFAVRFRWIIVAAWVAAAVLANLFLPSLTSVATQDNASLLPASSPSAQAARMAAPFQGIGQTPVTVIVARDQGRLTAADLAATGRLAAGLARVPHVQRVRDLGVSRDGRAVQLQARAIINASTDGPAQQLAAGLRHAVSKAALI